LGKYLLFSDSPETISSLPLAAGSNSTNTLMKAEIDLSGGDVGVRAVPYHKNSTGSQLVIGLAGSVSRNSATLSDLVYDDRASNWVKEPTGFSKRRIAGLISTNPVLAPLTSNDSGTETPILVNPGQTKTLIIALANAGTATLPVNILLSRLSMVVT
jgi:hypothetical protein